MLLKVWGGEGRGRGGGSFVAWLEEGRNSLSLSLSLCLPTYLAALKGVMESRERKDSSSSSSSRGLISTAFLFDGRTDNSQKAKVFSFKELPDLEKRFSNRVCQVIGGRGEKPAYWTR